MYFFLSVQTTYCVEIQLTMINSCSCRVSPLSVMPCRSWILFIDKIWTRDVTLRKEVTNHPSQLMSVLIVYFWKHRERKFSACEKKNEGESNSTMPLKWILHPRVGSNALFSELTGGEAIVDHVRTWMEIQIRRESIKPGWTLVGPVILYKWYDNVRNKEKKGMNWFISLLI